jgi:hypothetical protein
MVKPSRLRAARWQRRLFAAILFFGLLAGLVGGIGQSSTLVADDPIPPPHPNSVFAGDPIPPPHPNYVVAGDPIPPPHPNGQYN